MLLVPGRPSGPPYLHSVYIVLEVGDGEVYDKEEGTLRDAY